MTPGDPIAPRNALVDRAKAILLKPRETWPVIDAEPATTQGLYTGYAMILAAIGPIAGLIGGQLFGYGGLGFSFRPSLLSSLSGAVFQYIASLIGIFLLALLVDYLAPRFGGQRDRVKALKIAVYSATAGWLAGIFGLIPALSFLSILGLYSLYLLYTGLPFLMKVPADKAGVYTVVIVAVGAVVGFLFSLLLVPFFLMMGPSPYAASSSGTSGTVTVPGMGSVDLAKLEAASKKMEAAAKQMEGATKDGVTPGKAAAVPPATLQALLPASIGGYSRTEVESSGIGAGGSHASGRYTSGDKSFQVEITDMAAMGALAGMGAAFNVNSNRETATSYEKTSTVNGEIVSESWDKSSNDGKYGTTIANRFMVEASGQAGSIDALKAAVAAVGPAKLAALAK